jgi:LCP family protein required for cell wall assembly
VTARWPRRMAIALATVIVATTLVGAGYQAFLGQLQGNITTIDISGELGPDSFTSPLVVDEATNGYAPFTVVLMGSDSRQGKRNRGYGKASELGGERSDTTVLLHVNAERNSALAVSIPRDTWVTLPTCKVDGKTVGGKPGRFNEAMDIGGPACTLKALRDLTGLDIDKFMMVDFGGFKRVVDAIGGVEICLNKDVNDKQSGLSLSKGTHIVTGEEALAFVRTRKTLGDGSDTSRIRRQQAFMSSLFKTVLSSGTLLNPTKVLGVLDAATKSLTADPQLSDIGNLQELALSMRELRPNQMTFVTMPWLPRGDNATVVINETKAAPLWEAIANDTSWPPARPAEQPVLRVAPEDIRVNVVNASGTKGLAKRVAKQLREQGYNVVSTKNDKTSQETTTTVQFDPRWNVSARTLRYAADADGKRKKGQGSTMNLILGTDFAEVKPVVVSALNKDITANLNTGDEKFCAE